MDKKTKSPQPVEVSNSPKTANQILREFLLKHNIELFQTDLKNSIKTVSDGSILIDKPIVEARFIERS